MVVNVFGLFFCLPCWPEEEKTTMDGWMQMITGRITEMFPQFSFYGGESTVVKRPALCIRATAEHVIRR